MSSSPGTTLRVPTLSGHDFNLPRGLEGLDDLAYNLWWSWTPRAGALFSRLDPAAWARHRNPIAVLAGMDAARWEVASADEEFLVDASRLLDEYHRYMGNGSDSWYQQQIASDPSARSRARSPTSAPSTASTSRCRSTPAAWACWPVTIASRRPMRPCPSSASVSCTAAATSASRSMPMGTRSTRSRTSIRRCCLAPSARRQRLGVAGQRRLPRPPGPRRGVGRAGRAGAGPAAGHGPAANTGPDRPITHILYVRGREMRLCQELILGIGGVRALGELGIAPAVWHLNEGHSAFLLLERAREAMADDTGLSRPMPSSRWGTMRCSPSAVAAGNETFDRGLVRKYMEPWLHVTGMEDEELLELGRGRTDDPSARST